MVAQLIVRIVRSESPTLRERLPLPVLPIARADEVLLLTALACSPAAPAPRTHLALMSTRPELVFFFSVLLAHPRQRPFRGIHAEALDALTLIERSSPELAARATRTRTQLTALLVGTESAASMVEKLHRRNLEGT